MFNQQILQTAALSQKAFVIFCIFTTTLAFYWPKKAHNYHLNFTGLQKATYVVLSTNLFGWVCFLAMLLQHKMFFNLLSSIKLHCYEIQRLS